MFRGNDSDSVDRAVKRLRWQVGCVRWLDRLLPMMAVYGFAYGVAVLALRYAWRVESSQLVWGAGGMLLLPLVCLLIEWRRLPPGKQIRALLDEHSRVGGLYMAAGAVDIGAWRPRLRPPRAPHLQWRAGQPGLLLLTALIFAATGLFAPMPSSGLVETRRLQLDSTLEELEAQIEVLEEETILEEEEALDLTEKLERIARESDQNDPTKTWEALDHLADSLREAAKTSIDEEQPALEEEALMKALLEAALNPDGTNGVPEALRRKAMEEFTKYLEENKEVLEQLAKLLEGAGLDPSDMTSLTSEELEALLESIDTELLKKLAKAGKLSEMRLIDPSELAKCKQGGNCSGEELAEWMEGNGSCTNLAAALCASGMVPMPGQGGVTRGRGDAPLTWKDPTSEEGMSFDEKALPFGSRPDFSDASLVGVSLAEPEASEAASGSSGIQLSGTEGRGASGTRQVILPKHRLTVDRYFDRKSNREGNGNGQRE